MFKLDGVRMPDQIDVHGGLRVCNWMGTAGEQVSRTCAAGGYTMTFALSTREWNQKSLEIFTIGTRCSGTTYATLPSLPTLTMARPPWSIICFASRGSSAWRNSTNW